MSIIIDHHHLQAYGLAFVKLDEAGASFETREDNFKSNYGCTSTVAFTLWNLIETSDYGSVSVRYFLMTLYFLKTRANQKQYMGLFGIKSDKTARTWTWNCLEIISQICDQLIRMPLAHQLPEGVDFICSGDGIHFHTNETRTDPERPFISEQQSHKNLKAGLSYVIYLSILESKVIRFDGPYDAGTGDATIFRDGMMNALPPNKIMIGDKGFRNKGIDRYVSTPNQHDDEELHDFKNRVMARQEHINERLCEFGVLDQRFTHNRDRKYKHKLCFKGCISLVQLSIAEERPLIPIGRPMSIVE